MTASHEWGTVTRVEVVDETQRMYNLTVDEAHTFFVGDGQWLVHYACEIRVSPVSEDWASKGAHIHVDIGGGRPVELAVRPDGSGGVTFTAVFSSEPSARVTIAIREAQAALATDRIFVDRLNRSVSESVSYMLQYGERGAARSAELHFLNVALDRILEEWS